MKYFGLSNSEVISLLLCLAIMAFLVGYQHAKWRHRKRKKK
jgi:hypothetical protein